MHNNISHEEKTKAMVKSAFEDQHIDIPNKEAMWAHIEKRLIKEHSHIRRKQGWGKFVVLITTMIVILLFLSQPTSTSAFTSLINTLEEWRDDVVRLIIRSPEKPEVEGTALTVPPPSDVDGSGIHVELMPVNVPFAVTLEEARQLLAIPMLLPDEDILKVYELEQIEVMYDELRGIYHWVAITYKGVNHTLLIMQEKLPENFIRTVEYDRESAQVKQTMVGMHDGHLIMYPDRGVVKIEWMIEDRLIMINGKMSEEHALEIANSLK